eukprot:m.273178 g.273178  ORF g.273178 m.273178 type:complete len:497 (+) comp17684_c0_seq8:2561-4051(+)
MLSAGMVDDSIRGRTEAYGGLAAELFRRIAIALGHSANATCGCFQANPNTTEEVFLAWLDEEDITVMTNTSLAEATLTNKTVTKLRLSNGASIDAGYVIDGTYEGDVAAAIGHPFSVGMESQASHGETFAGQGLCEGNRSTGWQSFAVDVNPFDTKSDALLPHVTASNITYGSASATIQSFNFRACLTTQERGVPLPSPTLYNESEWQLLDRYIVATKQAGKSLSLSTFFGCSSLAGGCDTNDGPAVSINPMGAETWNWPTANQSLRVEYRRRFVNYFLGYLHHLNTSDLLGSALKKELASHRLCSNTWTDVGHLPFIPYVREGRRIRGDVLYTQNDWNHRAGEPLPAGPLGYANASTWQNTTIGLGFWFIDAHASQAVAVGNKTQNAGCIQYGRSLMDAGVLHTLPLGLIAPQAALVGNLGMVNALSATHVGYQPLRVEPTFMVIGEAVGAAIALALQSHSTLHDIPREALTGLLHDRGAVLSRAALRPQVNNCC